MKKIWKYLFIMISMQAHSQNLVPNWSFEDTINCPTTLGQIDNSIGWMSFAITPDYFNNCASSTAPVPVSVPHNIWGDQNAHSGNAYAGFVAFKSGGSNVREFIAIQLSQALVVGMKYFLKFYVSSAFGYSKSISRFSM